MMARYAPQLKLWPCGLIDRDPRTVSRACLPKPWRRKEPCAVNRVPFKGLVWDR